MTIRSTQRGSISQHFRRSRIPQISRALPTRVIRGTAPKISKTILVAGGAGFLGSHLCAHLLADGHKVICLDNFDTGTESNIRSFANSSNFWIVKQDVAIPFHGNVDEIYNLACPASPPHYQADRVHTTKTCVLGGISLLELAREKNALIFQASTSEVYGDSQMNPQIESYWGNVNPIGPRACYDEGKRCAETLFFDYNRQFSTSIRVARIFNTYGPRMRPDDGRVISNFIMQALQNENLTIYGNGEQTRSFCYVDDLIDGILQLMAVPGECVGPINLGNPDEFSIHELADLILAITGSKSKIVYLPLPVDDPHQRRPDISEAMKRLDWCPTVPLVDGLNRTIAYFDNLLGKQGRLCRGELADVPAILTPNNINHMDGYAKL